jgi:ABC-type transporter Mla MlaB component
MDTKLKVEIVKNKDNEWTLVLKGPLDEFAVLPVSTGSTQIRMDLKDVSHLNSSGIQIWCQWLNRQSTGVLIYMENCPFVIAKHFSTVRGVLTPNIVVESFFVPYYSSLTGERKDQLYRLGKEFYLDGSVHHPRVIDSKGNEMEMDIFPETYFSFLKK